MTKLICLLSYFTLTSLYSYNVKKILIKPNYYKLFTTKDTVTLKINYDSLYIPELSKYIGGNHSIDILFSENTSLDSWFKLAANLAFSGVEHYTPHFSSTLWAPKLSFNTNYSKSFSNLLILENDSLIFIEQEQKTVFHNSNFHAISQKISSLTGKDVFFVYTKNNFIKNEIILLQLLNKHNIQISIVHLQRPKNKPSYLKIPILTPLKY